MLGAAWGALPIAVLAIGLERITKKASELNDEINRLNSENGVGQRGFLGNLADGYGEIFGTNEAPGAGPVDMAALRAERDAKKRAEAEKAAAIKAAEDQAKAVAKAEDAERRKLAVQSQIAAAAWEEELRGKPGWGTKAKASYGSAEWLASGSSDEERLRRLQIMEDLAADRKRTEEQQTAELKRQTEERIRLAKDEARDRAAAAKDGLRAEAEARRNAADRAQSVAAAARDRADQAAGRAAAARDEALSPQNEARQRARSERQRQREERVLERRAAAADRADRSGLASGVSSREREAQAYIRRRNEAQQAAKAADGAAATAAKALATVTEILEKITKMMIPARAA
jgi:hypothetical protein